MLKPKGIPFVNADLIAKEVFPDNPESRSYNAALIAEEMRTRLLREGRTFCFETVFSHPSKIDFLAQAKANDYEIVLIFIHLDNVSLNHARIAQRVGEGGHNVPPEKVETRIPRTLINVKTVLPLCDSVYLLDNSSAIEPFNQVALIHQGKLRIKSTPLPDWADNLLSSLCE